VGSLVTAHPHAVGMDCKPAPSCDKCAVELLGFRLVKTMEPRGQPPRASVGEDGQGDIDVHRQADRTGQAVQGQDIDPAAEAVLHTVAASLAADQLPRTGGDGVGDQQRELAASQAVKGQVPQGASGPSECHRLVHRADVLGAAWGDVDPRPTPGLSWESVQTPQEGSAPAPHRHAPEATRMAAGQCRIRGQLGVAGHPRRLVASAGRPACHAPPHFSRLSGPGQVRVRRA